MYPEGQEILVIIADRGQREHIARTLRDEGFAVTATAEGLAALRAVAARRYALMIAAPRLPGSLDGKTTVRQARSRQPWLKALYIEDGATWREHGASGAEDVIAVPFERHELVGCTFELLQRDGVAEDDLARRARIELHAS